CGVGCQPCRAHSPGHGREGHRVEAAPRQACRSRQEGGVAMSATPRKPAKKNKKRVSRLIVADDLPPAAQAASLAISLCKAAKVDTFTELEEKVRSGDEKVLAALASIRLTPEQVDLISQNM